MLTSEQSVNVLVERAANHVLTGVYIQDALLCEAVELWKCGEADGLLMWLYQLGEIDKLLLMRRVRNAVEWRVNVVQRDIE